MHCHLLIPDLLPRRAVTAQNDPLHGVAAPALQTLLARSRVEHSMAGDMESWLCEAFGVRRSQDYPVASLCLQALGVKPGNSYWLRADPVHLAVERDQLILEQAPVNPLSAQESAALVATLNLHFAGDGLHFVAPRPQHWYLRLDNPADIATHTLHRALGQSIQPLLPSGPETMRWRSLLNEIQMLLFNHPVNEAREMRGETTLNSIWPWGGGTLPNELQTPFDRIWANDVLARGIALVAGIPEQFLPKNGDEWLESVATGNNLVVLDSLRAPACYGDPHGWREQLAQLEQRWFLPFRRAVQKGGMELTLHIPAMGGTSSFTCKRSTLWKLWKPIRPLTSYRPPEQG